MRRSGVIAKKVGMSAIFTPEGRRIPVTLLEVDCCVVAQQIQKEAGVCALQVGSGAPKHVTKPMRGYFDKAGVRARSLLRTFRVDEEALMPVGALLKPDYFAVDQYVDVVGTTIGRGFAGVMKRHNFGGLRASHGVSVSHRSHGSTGQRKDPGKVFKGKKMAGHMGCVRVTLQNLRVVAVDVEHKLLVVHGAVPGYEGSFVCVSDAVKKVANTPVPTFSEEELERIVAPVQEKKAKKAAAPAKKSDAPVKKAGGSEDKIVDKKRGEPKDSAKEPSSSKGAAEEGDAV